MVPPECFHRPEWAEKWLACRMNSFFGQNPPRLFRCGFSVLLCVLWIGLYAVPVQSEEDQSEQDLEQAVITEDAPLSARSELPSVPGESQNEPAAQQAEAVVLVPAAPVPGIPVPAASVPDVPVPDAPVPASVSHDASSAEPLSGDALLHEFAIPPAPPPPRWLFTAENVPQWQKLDTGLELGLFPGRTSIGQALQMVILRIDPKEYTFSVLTVPPDEEARSLGDWADRDQLAAVINASMYLPDGRTSTGYLRSGEQVNNSRIVTRFGAFFVAGPNTPDMPGAALLDRTEDPWEALLPQYSMVVQNYRLISAGRRLLWNPGGPQHSIAAVGRDGTGAILFVHCREPLTGVDFGTLLLALPIDIRLVMYVEGGSQAGLLIRTQQLTQTWMGRHPVDLWTSGNEQAPLPNVIGIRKRQ